MEGKRREGKEREGKGRKESLLQLAKLHYQLAKLHSQITQLEKLCFNHNGVVLGKGEGGRSNI